MELTQMGTSWHSYPKIYNLGHRALESLFNGEVVIEEKLDGSQFSFGVFDGVLRVRSSGREFHPDAADNMFKRAVDSVIERQHLLTDGWTYRGEYFQSPKHNTLKYDRVPVGGIAIFDISTGDSSWLGAIDKVDEAERIGLSHVPVLYTGILTHGPESLAWFEQLIDAESVLGGVKMEGVVIKNYSQFGPDKKTLMGKHVSSHFKEVHGGEWKKNNPSKVDFLQGLGERYCTEARWQKGIQHLKESGRYTQSPQDIGPLVKEIQSDVILECKDEILAELWKWAKPQIERIASRGVPEWYKQQLLENQFEGVE